MEKTFFEFKEKATEYKLKAVRNENFKKAQIKTSIAGADYARQFYHGDIAIYESTFVILLNRSLNTVGYAKISQGGISGTVVDIRLILKYAIDNLASAIILVHNHPSGALVASPQDIHISKKLKDAAKMMEIDLIDSIILTEDAYYSLADNEII